LSAVAVFIAGHRQSVEASRTLKPLERVKPAVVKHESAKLPVVVKDQAGPQDKSQQQNKSLAANTKPLGLSLTISQLPKLCVKITILMHRRMWVRFFSTRLTSVTFAEDKVLIFLILRKNAKIVQL